MAEKELRVCTNGHKYYKSSDCPVCPVCEKEKVPDTEFLAQLSAPARRALKRAGIKTLQQLSAHTEKELLAMHGFGPGSIPKLRQSLTEAGLKFNDTQ